jgi:formyl-CoA transferase
VGISIGDTLAASYACTGALAALHARATTGKGQVVDTALYESVLQVMESLIPEYAVSGEVRTRSGSVLPGIAPSNVYTCSDGELLIAANKDELFVRLARAMAMPELADSPMFASHVARGRHQTELDAIISQWTSTRSVAQVERAMIDAEVPAGRVYRAPEMLCDAHFLAREAIVEVDTERWGAVKMQGCCPRLSLTPSSVRSAAPVTVGEHNFEIYSRWLGLSADDMASLFARGVI